VRRSFCLGSNQAIPIAVGLGVNLLSAFLLRDDHDHHHGHAMPTMTMTPRMSTATTIYAPTSYTSRRMPWYRSSLLSAYLRERQMPSDTISRV